VSEKETQLLLAEQEMDRVQLCLDTSVKAKARALSALDSAQRKAFDLRAKLCSLRRKTVSRLAVAERIYGFRRRERFIFTGLAC